MSYAGRHSRCAGLAGNNTTAIKAAIDNLDALREFSGGEAGLRLSLQAGRKEGLSKAALTRFVDHHRR
ncbi:hypothetical protein KCP78_10960 [Salmonella enterica subsp. enterica]|nr:hypothetical protein KCP78_10960 [Salmonella enterica subsp. enterica]